MSDGKHPWKPGILRDRDDFDGFLYMVVEEEIDDTIGLVVTDWPLGANGAPRFQDDAEEFEVAAERGALLRHLSDREVDTSAAATAEGEPPIPAVAVPALQAREITVGDVFAIRPTAKISADTDPELLYGCEWIGEAFDVTAEAREAAKVAMYKALTPPLDKAVADHLLAESKANAEGGA